MINHNKVLRELIDRKISILYNGNSNLNNFIEGDIFEVWKVLNECKTKFPLIWLQSGYTVKSNNLPGNHQVLLENCNFYLITKGDSLDFYEKRYNDTYERMLYPLLERFKSLLAKSKGVILGDEYEFITFPFNDQDSLRDRTNKVKPQTSTLSDIWDAIYLNIDVTINGDCYPEFKIKI